MFVDIGIGEFYNDIVISSKEKSYVNTFIEQGLGQGYTLIDQGNLKEYKREWYKYKKGKYMLGISNTNGTYKVSLSFDK